MIKDDLTLDGTPTLNLASFVTTYMVSGYTLTPKKRKERNYHHPAEDTDQS
jgi:hypothetical protein